MRKPQLLAGFLLLAPLVLAGCAAGPSDSWRPQPYPSPQADGYKPPTGPHLITVQVTVQDAGSYQAQGYMNLTSDGGCALDLQFAETDEKGAITKEGEVVKAPGTASFIFLAKSSDRRTPVGTWFDVASPDAPIGTIAAFASPLYLASPGNPNTASWCFLNALPYFTNAAENATGEYQWNTEALTAYLNAENDAFVAAVGDKNGLSPLDRAALAESTRIPEWQTAQFPSQASPLKTSSPRPGTAVLDYSIGRLDVNIVLAPTPPQDVKAPAGATPWDYQMSDFQ